MSSERSQQSLLNPAGRGSSVGAGPFMAVRHAAGRGAVSAVPA